MSFLAFITNMAYSGPAEASLLVPAPSFDEGYVTRFVCLAARFLRKLRTEFDETMWKD